MNEQNKANLVDVEFLAKFYRVEERTIQLWAKEFSEELQIEVRFSKGEYDFVKFVHAKNLHYEDEIKKLELGDVTLYQAQKDNWILKNEEKRLDLAKKRNENIDREIIMIAWKSEVHLFGKSMRALPGLIATMIPDTSTYEQRFLITSKHRDEILIELSTTEIIETEERLERELDDIENKNIIADGGKQSQEDEG